MQGFSKFLSVATVVAGLGWCGVASAQVPPPPSGGGVKVKPVAKPAVKPVPKPAVKPVPTPADPKAAVVPAPKPGTTPAAATPAKPAQTPEQKKAAEEAKKKAAEEAEKKKAEAKKKQEDTKRLQKIMRLKYDRRPSAMLKAWATPTKEFFWGVALVSGLGIGGLQAASRGFVSILSPVAKSGEFFGFWGLSLRAAFALGPLVFGATSALAGSQRTAILVTTVFFVAGFLGMFFVDQEEGRRAAEAWDERDEARAAVG